MPSSHLILCSPLLLLHPIRPSIRVFSNESTLCMRWPKYWSFSFSIIPSKEIPGLISFRRDWLDLLAVQGTLKSLLQHHSSKASILRLSSCRTTRQEISLLPRNGRSVFRDRQPEDFRLAIRWSPDRESSIRSFRLPGEAQQPSPEVSGPERQ